MRVVQNAHRVYYVINGSCVCCARPAREAGVRGATGGAGRRVAVSGRGGKKAAALVFMGGRGSPANAEHYCI